jgi:hypothetical protein
VASQGDGEHAIDALDHRTFLLRIVCRIADASFSHIAPERRVKPVTARIFIGSANTPQPIYIACVGRTTHDGAT